MADSQAGPAPPAPPRTAATEANFGRSRRRHRVAADVSELYDAWYFDNCCGVEYRRNESWLGFFGGIAELIVSEIAPRSALDAGCAMGFLVEALRDRGVDAYGIDVSEYALEQVREDVRPYVHSASVTEPLPRRYDLIVCIEVLEHLPEKEATAALANLAAHADDLLFSSTPIDFAEATHVNVKPPDWWAERLAREGLFRDIDFDATLITPWAARFRRDARPIPRVIAAYERRLWHLMQDNRGARTTLAQVQDALREADATSTRETALKTELGAMKQERDALETELGAVRRERDALETELHALRATKTLRYTRPLRSAWGHLRSPRSSR
jgi:Methyltransferase domain